MLTHIHSTLNRRYHLWPCLCRRNIQNRVTIVDRSSALNKDSLKPWASGASRDGSWLPACHQHPGKFTSTHPPATPVSYPLQRPPSPLHIDSTVVLAISTNLLQLTYKKQQGAMGCVLTFARTRVQRPKLIALRGNRDQPHG